MGKLNLKQLNNLKVGNTLASELLASSDELRRFVCIGAYIDDGMWGKTPSKFGTDEDLTFWIIEYEIKKEYIENDWDVADDDLEHLYRNDLKSIEELEKEVSQFLDDFSSLVVEWNCENPY